MTILIGQENIVNEEEIKKSRFICSMRRVYTEAEARDFIGQIKKKNQKANHNCSAFILGPSQQIQRSSDDGEPSGTAGVPMLEVLKKRKVTNVCAVVTRYFGGIKLGAGGLIRAYAGSVAQALDQVGLVRLVELEELILTLDYRFYDGLQQFLSTQDLKLARSDFSTQVTSRIFLQADQIPNFLTLLADEFSGKIPVTRGSKQLAELPIESGQKMI